jgi:hypothetical protein
MMKPTLKFTLLAAVAVIGFNANPAQADMRTAGADKPTVTTTRVTTITETELKSADVNEGQEAEKAIEYQSGNGGTLHVDRNFAMFDDNRNGSISKIEYVKHIPASSPTKFEEVDRDGNGMLNETEFNGVTLEEIEVTETYVTEKTEVLDHVPTVATDEVVIFEKPAH